MNSSFCKILSACMAILMTSTVFTNAAELSEAEKVRVVDDKVEETVPITINIDESNIICPADDKMLGLQYEIGSEKTTTLVGDGTSGELEESYIEFAKNTLYKIPLVRMGGGSAEGVSFIRNIGSYMSRQESVRNEFYHVEAERGKKSGDTLKIGPVEWIKGVLANNENAEFIPCISMKSATPEENANFAQFLLDDKNASTWGKLRAAYGIENPVKVYAFELGNEIDYSPRSGWGFDKSILDWYIDIAHRNIDAIRAVCPEAKFMICGKTVPDLDDDAWREWTLTTTRELADACDYTAFHQYYGGYHMAYTRPYRDDIAEDINTVLGEGNTHKIVITEHAKWPVDATNGSPDMIGLQSVLNTGLFLARMYTRPDVCAATYHSWNTGGYWWSMFNRYDNGEYGETGLAQMYKIYQQHVGDRVVTSEIVGDSDYVDPLSFGERVNVVTMAKDKRELNVIITNFTKYAEFPITFNFNNNYTLNSKTVFTAPNMESYVTGPETQDVFITDVDDTQINDFNSITVPPKCMMFLKLTSDKDLKLLEGEAEEEIEVVFDGETTFTDIDNCWAKGEIASMAESGIINGKDALTFSPYTSVISTDMARGQLFSQEKHILTRWEL